MQRKVCVGTVVRSFTISGYITNIALWKNNGYKEKKQAVNLSQEWFV